MKRFERLSLFLGLAVLAFLVAHVGRTETAKLLSLGGYAFLPVVALGIVPHGLDALGLFYCLPSSRSRVGYGYTFAGRLAGEGVNSVLPTATVGGELLKASFLARRTTFGQALTAVTTTYAIDAMTIMVLAGACMPLALPRLALSPLAGLFLASFVLAGIVGTYIFYRIVRSGSLAFLPRFLQALVAGRAPGAFPSGAGNEPSPARAFFYMLLSTAWPAVEIAIVRYVLTGEVGIVEALAIASVSGFADAVFFFVPGNIGTREGGLAAITALAGLGAPLGLAIGVVRRVSQITWALAGYGCFLWLERGELRLSTTPATAIEVVS